MNNLIARVRHTRRLCPIAANSIASQLIKNRTYKTTDRESARLVIREMSQCWRIPTPPNKCISKDFSPKKFANTLKLLKPGQTPGPDSLCPELILHASSAVNSCLKKFLSSCMCQPKLLKICRRALLVAIPKPNIPSGNPKSCRPVSLLCVPFKISEKLICARVELKIDSLLPREQSGIRRKRSTVDQVILLNQNFKITFWPKRKPAMCLSISH